ncbi:MAG: peptide-binding protein [Nitrospirota bacterium]|nr:MAG: peptide-binding protein [Nitrospirota bacterium]
MPIMLLIGCDGKTSPADSSSKVDYASETGAPAYGDALIVGSIGEPSVLIPMLAGDSASHDVAGLIFNGLVKYDTDLSIIGDLAENWDISPDGLTITFYLRRGVKWTDSVEFTAHDVMFGYKTIIDDKTPTAYKEDFLQVEKAEVIDDHTFRVSYKKPFAPALSSWGSMPVVPRHLLEGKDITKVDYRRKPIGMGPYILEKWDSGEKLELRSNKDYFEDRPYIDRYIYRIIPDTATMFLELQAGSIDLMGLTPLQYSKQTNTDFFKKNYQKFKYPASGYTYLGFNFKNDKFKSKKIRQAIAYAIDKQEIIDVVLFGLGSIATGPYVPNTWPYNPDVERYSYNPEMARQLMAEEGWKDSDGDGWLDKNGERFKFTIITNLGNDSRKKTAEIIQWRLKKIGIDVEIRIIEWATFINEFIDKRRFEACLLGWGIDRDPDQYIIWHSSKTKEKEFNFISYSNKEVDDLLEKGRRKYRIEDRKKIYFKIQEILADEVPYVFLYVPDALPIVHSRFKGIVPTPIGISYNLHEWYVPANLQKHKLLP